ncbi:MAG: pseudouridine synthase, partial [Candidatus Paceibacteria bacterium]
MKRLLKEKRVTSEPKVLYEDNDVAFLAKPAGIAVHPSPSGHDGKALVDFILKKWPDIRHVGEDPLRPGIVHRLDKETSGVILIAKTQKAFFYLKEKFQKREVKKSYIA